MANLKYWQAVNQALVKKMERDPAVLVMGKDVGEPGGPFGATAKLLERFGPSRVRDTPISEAAIVGAALGAAMTAPMVIRTLVGAGRGTGLQHSQSFEAWLGSVPGLKMVWGSDPANPGGLLKSAIRDDNPMVIVEILALWTDRGTPADPNSLVPVGTAAVARPGSDVTVVTWGTAVRRVLSAADRIAPDVDVEVIDLRTSSPLDEETVLVSVSRAGRLVVVHDSPGRTPLEPRSLRCQLTERSSIQEHRSDG